LGTLNCMHVFLHDFSILKLFKRQECYLTEIENIETDLPPPLLHREIWVTFYGEKLGGVIEKLL